MHSYYVLAPQHITAHCMPSFLAIYNQQGCTHSKQAYARHASCSHLLKLATLTHRVPLAGGRGVQASLWAGPRCGEAAYCARV